MPLNVPALQALVDAAGPRQQAAVARRMGIGKSTLTQLLTSGERAANVSWRTVQRMAENYGVDFRTLWIGPADIAEPAVVPRGTTATVGADSLRTVPEPAHGEGAFWAISQMSLAIADIAQRASERYRPRLSPAELEAEARATLAARDAAQEKGKLARAKPA